MITALRSNPAVWIMIAIGVVSLAAGLAIGALVVSPGEAAASKAPKEGLITVEAETREISNDVVIRGEAMFADPVEVTVETASIAGPAVVTGRVPEVGTEIGPASVALEVVGRPVIVLPGELPVYRDFTVGAAGPDVTQLKQALAAVGHNPGNLGSDVYDVATAAAVAALYATVGYPAPAAEEGTAESLRSARDSVAAAQLGLAAAHQDLASAQAGPSTVERLQADAAVAAAQRALQEAKSRTPAEPAAVAEASENLAIAEASRAALLAPANASSEAAGVTAAQRQLASAQAALADAEKASFTSLPASEVVFLGDLPRRVDDVTVSRGSTIDGTVMTVSGATLVVSASAAAADAELLAEGDVATVELQDGSELGLKVASLGAGQAAAADDDGGGEDAGGEATTTASGRVDVVLSPVAITPAQVEALRGTSVKVTIPVDSTGGAVLAVPIAAVSGGPGGESRIEVADGDKTRFVEVEVGLAAAGYVEITSGDVAEGDLVVVGR